MSITGEPSTAQATWVLPMRERYATDERRVSDCEGCMDFGLCALHGSAGVRTSVRLDGVYKRR